MKIAKKIDIMGHEFKVLIQHKDGCGGSFDCINNTITIEPDEVDKPAVLLHEIVEIILCLMRTHSDRPPERRFVLIHHPWDDEVSDSFTTFCEILYDTLHRNGVI